MLSLGILTIYFVIVSIYYIQEESKCKKREEELVGEEEIKILFYIYESKLISELWEKCFMDKIEKRSGLIFVEQLRNHRWRTFDPDQAALFIVPFVTVFDGETDGDHHHCLHFKDLVHPIIKEITSTKYYQKMNGRDHILVDTWWRATTIASRYNFVAFYESVIVGAYGKTTTQNKEFKEIKNKNKKGVKRPFNNNDFIDSGLTYKCMVYVPFTSNYKEIITRPIKERKIDFFFLGEIDGQKPFRRKVIENFPKLENKTVRIMDVGNTLKLEVCPFKNSPLESNRTFEKCHIDRTQKYFEWITNSKISLMIRGHDFESERLFSTLTSGTINLIFSDYIFEAGIPFQCFIPWRDFVLQINSTDFFNDPITSLKNITSLSNDDLQNIQNNIFKYQKDVLWNHPESRVAENVLKQAVRKCFSLQWLEEKKLDQFKKYQCKYKDVEDRYGDKIIMKDEIY